MIAPMLVNIRRVIISRIVGSVSKIVDCVRGCMRDSTHIIFPFYECSDATVNDHDD